MPPAARVGDSHACPAHVGGPVREPASGTVNIGGQPAARAGDRAGCSGQIDTIVQGSPTVFIDGRPAARVGDRSAHSGLIVTGCPTVIIGNAPGLTGEPGAGGGGGGVGPGPGGPGTPGGGGGSSGGNASGPGGGAGAAGGAAAGAAGAAGEVAKKGGLRLFGVPITLDTVRSIAKLAQQMIPGLALRMPPVDPMALQSAVAQLRAAIEARDVEGVNALTAQITALMQNGGVPPVAAQPGADAGPAPPQNTSSSPWTWKGP